MENLRNKVKTFISEMRGGGKSKGPYVRGKIGRDPNRKLPDGKPVKDPYEGVPNAFDKYFNDPKLIEKIKNMDKKPSEEQKKAASEAFHKHSQEEYKKQKTKD